MAANRWFLVTLATILTSPMHAQPMPGQMAAQSQMQHMAIMQSMSSARALAAAQQRAKRRREMTASLGKTTHGLDASRKPSGEAWRLTYDEKATWFGLPDGNLLPVVRKLVTQPYPRAREVWTYALEMVDLTTGKAKWSLPPVDDPIPAPMLLEDIVVYCNEKFSLVAVERDTGKVRFSAVMDPVKEFVFDHRVPPISEIIPSGEALYVVTNGKNAQGVASSRAYGFDRKTGKRMWAQDLVGTPALTPLVCDEVVLITAEARLYGLDPISGAVKWEYSDPEDIPVSSASMIGSHVFVRCKGGKLAALDPRTGRKRLSFAIPSSHSQIVGDGDRIFMIEYRTFGKDLARAFDATTGKVAWTQEVENSTGVSWAQEGAVLLQNGSTLKCLSLGDGKELWKFTSEQKAVGFPTPFADQVLFGTSEKKVNTTRLLEFKTGKELWSIALKAKPGTVPPLGAEGCLLFFSSDDTLVGLR